MIVSQTRTSPTRPLLKHIRYTFDLSPWHARTLLTCAIQGCLHRSGARGNGKETKSPSSRGSFVRRTEYFSEDSYAQALTVTSNISPRRLQKDNNISFCCLHSLPLGPVLISWCSNMISLFRTWAGAEDQRNSKKLWTRKCLLSFLLLNFIFFLAGKMWATDLSCTKEMCLFFWTAWWVKRGLKSEGK